MKLKFIKSNGENVTVLFQSSKGEDVDADYVMADLNDTLCERGYDPDMSCEGIEQLEDDLYKVVFRSGDNS